LGKNFNNSWKIGPNFFLQHIKNKIILSFVKFVAKKNGLTRKIFSTLSFVAVFGSGIRDPGSGMGKNQDPGSGINIPDPQHWQVHVPVPDKRAYKPIRKMMHRNNYVTFHNRRYR
jgi:hypothetical protein